MDLSFHSLPLVALTAARNFVVIDLSIHIKHASTACTNAGNKKKTTYTPVQ